MRMREEGNSWSEGTKRGKWRSSKYAICVGVVNPKIQETGLSFEELELAQSIADRAHGSAISEGLCSSGKGAPSLANRCKKSCLAHACTTSLLICLDAFVTDKIQINSRGWMNSWPLLIIFSEWRLKHSCSQEWRPLFEELAPVSSFYRQMNKGVVKNTGFAEDPWTWISTHYLPAGNFEQVT